MYIKKKLGTWVDYIGYKHKSKTKSCWIYFNPEPTKYIGETLNTREKTKMQEMKL